jgi:voltage-gated potassium channel
MGAQQPQPPVRPGSLPPILALARPLAIVTVLLVWYFLVPLRRPGTLLTISSLAGGLLLVAVFVAWQARAVANSAYPGIRATAALLVSFSVLVVLFATAYLLIATMELGAFTEPLNRIDALYFTISVFSTVGFGDIAPCSTAARIGVTGQMLADLVFVGLAARVLTDAVRRSSQISARTR